MKTRSCWVVLCICAGLSCTNANSAPNGQIGANPEDGRDAEQCSEVNGRVSDGCVNEEEDGGPRRAPSLDAGRSTPDAGSVKLLDAGRQDGGSDPGDAGLGSDAADASFRSDAGNASFPVDGGDAALLNAAASCGTTANRFAIAGDDEFVYQGPGLIVDELDGSTVYLEADDAGRAREILFSLPNASWQLWFSTRGLDAGMNVGTYQDAESVLRNGFPMLRIESGGGGGCPSTQGEFEIFEINVRPHDLDAGTPAQPRSFHARFETHCQDGTRYNFLQGCFRYTASP